MTQKPKAKVMFILPALMLMAASCGPFGSKEITAGVAKSENGGTDWTLVNKLAPGTDKASQKNPGTITTSKIASLVFAPEDTRRIYAISSNNGIYFSSDAATSWRKILSKVQVSDFAISPLDSQHLYAVGTSGDHGKVLESKDGGKSWAEIYTEASPTNPVRSIALNPNNPSELVIGLQSGNLVKSVDGGQTWTAGNKFKDRILRLRWQGEFLYVFMKASGLYRSRDGGQNFENVTAPLLELDEAYSKYQEQHRLQQVDAPESPDIPKQSVSVFNQMAVFPTDPNLIYIAGDSGLFKTVDGGKTWAFMKLPVKGADVIIRTVAFGPTPDYVYASAGNTLYKTLNGGQTWQVQTIAVGAIINYILVDPGKPQIVYVGLTSN